MAFNHSPKITIAKESPNSLLNVNCQIQSVNWNILKILYILIMNMFMGGLLFKNT